MRRERTAVWVMLLASVLLAGCEPEATRDEAGSVVTDGAIDAFAMKVGDCFDDQMADQIVDVPGRPCSEPHDNEVYAIFDVVLNEYPGEDEMMRIAEEKCVARFEAFVGRDYPSSELYVMPLTPTAEGWARLNDREVICALFRGDGEKLTGTMRGAAI